MSTNGPQPPDGYDRPLDYPEDAGLPPPVYPTPHPNLPGSGYHTPHLGYPAYPGNASYFPPPPGTNGKAVTALVCALAGLMCCGLTSLIALILGPIAMSETKRTGQNGRGMALAAVIISGLTVGAWVVYILVYTVVEVVNG